MLIKLENSVKLCQELTSQGKQTIPDSQMCRIIIEKEGSKSFHRNKMESKQQFRKKSAEYTKKKPAVQIIQQ